MRRVPLLRPLARCQAIDRVPREDPAPYREREHALRDPVYGAEQVQFGEPVVPHRAEHTGDLGGGDLLHLLALERGEVPIAAVSLVLGGSLRDGSPSLPLLEHLGER